MRVISKEESEVYEKFILLSEDERINFIINWLDIINKQTNDLDIFTKEISSLCMLVQPIILNIRKRLEK